MPRKDAWCELVEAGRQHARGILSLDRAGAVVDRLTEERGARWVEYVQAENPEVQALVSDWLSYTLEINGGQNAMANADYRAEQAADA